MTAGTWDLDFTGIQCGGDVKEASYRILKGIKTVYDPEIHIPLLYELFSKGHGVAAFCSTVHIAKQTFFTWIETHPEFEEAYEKAKDKAQALFESMAMQNISDPSFNTKLWSMLMRNRFDYTEHRKLKITGLKAAKNVMGQFMQVLGELEKGNLTASEGQCLGNLIALGAKIEEMTSIKEDVERLKLEVLESKK